MIIITDQPLDPNVLTDAVRDDSDGAVITFEGVTRNHNDGRGVEYLEYEAYRPMAEEKLQELIDEIKERWEIDRVAVAHRIGRVDIGELSLVIAVSAAHRRPAFESTLHFIDRLKQVVPIWKKEYFEGGEVWIGDPGSERASA
ncbi:MAG: molybdenum cofactor biosynthesis protein MoaE [Dehalococcoidia bacterium]|jgi:molybdopterin synthase catalytic subunit|nr:molybdenum cofactor biosynthesis protein MoaE [Dehalococcoidia bacterium]